MAHEHLTYDDLLRIVELIRTSEQFSEFRLKIGEIEVELRRRGAAAAPASAAAASASEPLDPALSPSRAERETQDATSRPAKPAAPEPARTPPAWPPDAIVVRAPMVGTFFRAPQPGAPPFVEIGQAVSAETVVCIIEVMKLMNSICAGAQGTVRQILVDDAAAVETEQPLIVLDPARPGR